MKVLICGSRTFDDPKLLNSTMNALHAARPIRLVLSGGQKSRDQSTGHCWGADYLGEQWAVSRMIPYRTFEADWRDKGLAAGPLRNSSMVAELDPATDGCVASWDGKSKGTADTIAKSRAKGIHVKIVTFSKRAEMDLEDW